MNSTCQATVFYDEVGEASARLYALAAPTIDDRLLTVDELAECRFDCRVEGPTCRYSTTLQSRITLKHRGVTTWGDIPAVMAEGILPDPCPWSSELPFLYRVTGSVRLGGTVIAEINQTFGIRPMGAVRRRIVANGKVWVPRIVRREGVHNDTLLTTWRDTSTLMLVESPSDQLCADASAYGVMIAAWAPQSISLAATLSLLSRHASVGIVVLGSDQPLDQTAREAARNTLLARVNSVPGRKDSRKYYDLHIWTWEGMRSSSGRWLELQEVHFGSEKPTLAMRFEDGIQSLVEAREACDALQRDLAGKCDPAGYIV